MSSPFRLRPFEGILHTSVLQPSPYHNVHEPSFFPSKFITHASKQPSPSMVQLLPRVPDPRHSASACKIHRDPASPRHPASVISAYASQLFRLPCSPRIPAPLESPTIQVLPVHSASQHATSVNQPPRVPSNRDPSSKPPSDPEHLHSSVTARSHAPGSFSHASKALLLDPTRSQSILAASCDQPSSHVREAFPHPILPDPRVHPSVRDQILSAFTANPVMHSKASTFQLLSDP